MKRTNAIVTSILLTLGCWMLSTAAQAQPANLSDGHSIVGLWDVWYTSDFGPTFETHDMWHADGIEFEVNSMALGAVCEGTWKATPDRKVLLYHVGFSHGAVFAGSVRFVEVSVITVGQDGKTYDGQYDNKFYDADGGLVGEDTGSMHATRLTADMALQP